jgi:hypothetical protein
MLIENQNTNLKTLNNKIATELDKTKLGLEDKNKMLQLFYEQQGQVDLPPELLKSFEKGNGSFILFGFRLERCRNFGGIICFESYNKNPFTTNLQQTAG